MLGLLKRGTSVGCRPVARLCEKDISHLNIKKRYFLGCFPKSTFLRYRFSFLAALPFDAPKGPKPYFFSRAICCGIKKKR